MQKDAQKYKDKLYQLIQYESKKQLEVLKKQQSEELKLLETQHLEELNNFQLEWDDKLQKYEEYAKKLETTMQNKHEAEKEGLYNEIKEKFVEPKPTSEILNLRQIASKMIKQKRFGEVEEVKQKLYELELNSQCEFQKKKKAQLSSLLANLVEKQRIELDSLKLRIQNGLEEQKKLREKELDLLLQKYTNIKQEAEYRHQTEQTKYIKISQSSIFRSFARKI